MFRTTLSILSAIVIAGAAFPSLAQPSMLCGERANVISHLEKRFGEKPVSMGLAGNGSMVEVFASDGGSFTIIMTQPGGQSCMVTAGEGWSQIEVEKAGWKI